MISSFVSAILRYGRKETGLFGHCTAYYGTVEAQARGTLHCHMLLWLAGHPSPQKMRDLMEDSPDFQQRIFQWLESLIKTELLGTVEPVLEPGGVALTRPRFSERDGFVHPGVKSGPHIDSMSEEQFSSAYETYVNELVTQYNWHEHTETCWKYLRPLEKKTDENCRMRIDGRTRPLSAVDEETGSILLRRLHPRIANYNDLVMFCMRCNMDIKHIGSGEGAKALIFYITDYITKASLPAHLGLAALLYAINRLPAKFGDLSEWDQQHDGGALNILVNSMLSRTEISHPQILSYIVGGGDHYTSHSFRILHLGSFERLV
ncbi:hypothetical protein C8Q76DRAFT_594532, partial [Earliella scabrosa]